MFNVEIKCIHVVYTIQDSFSIYYFIPANVYRPKDSVHRRKKILVHLSLSRTTINTKVM